MFVTTASATRAFAASPTPFSVDVIGLSVVMSVFSDRPSAKATRPMASPTLLPLAAITFCTSVDSAVTDSDPAGAV